MTGVPLLRLARNCPRCGHPDGRWIYAWERDRWTQEHPERPIDWVVCDVCRTGYVIRAKHYQQSQPAHRA